MHTYSIVEVYHDYLTGQPKRFTLQGCTFLTVEAAYTRIMQDARDYTPVPRTAWREVVEDYLPFRVAVRAMGVPERAKCIEAVST